LFHCGAHCFLRDGSRRFLAASLLSGSAVLPQAQRTDIYLTALAIVLTVVYAWGLITRPQRQVLRMGIDSLVVLVLYQPALPGSSPWRTIDSRERRTPTAG
jgi:hypothetical protein